MAVLHDVKVERGLSVNGTTFGKFFAGPTNVREMSSSATGPHMEEYLSDNGRLGIQYHHLKGPTGATGPTGPSGPSGARGACGPNGAQGFCGPSGSSNRQGGGGVRGYCGPLGNTGPRGFCGPKGSCGPSGAPYTVNRLVCVAGEYSENTKTISSTSMTDLISFSIPSYSAHVCLALVRIYNAGTSMATINIAKYFGTTEKTKELYRIKPGYYITVPVFFKGGDSCSLKAAQNTASSAYTLKVLGGMILGVRA